VGGADGTPGVICDFDEYYDINGGDGDSVFGGGNPDVAIGGNGGAAGFGGLVRTAMAVRQRLTRRAVLGGAVPETST